MNGQIDIVDEIVEFWRESERRLYEERNRVQIMRMVPKDTRTPLFICVKCRKSVFDCACPMGECAEEPPRAVTVTSAQNPLVLVLNEGIRRWWKT